MKQFLLVWFALCFVSSAAISQIHFSSRSHDFADVYRGQILKHRFTFENTSQKPLSIQGIHTACGCTAVETDEGRVYQSGDTGYIDITFDTSEFEGKISKTITVMTNSKAIPDKILKISAFIKSEIEASPPIADFGEIDFQSTPEIKINIKKLTNPAPVVQSIEFNKKLINAQISQNEKGEQELVVQVIPGEFRGFIRESIIIKNDSKFLPELVIPVRGAVVGSITYNPHYLEFGAIEKESKTNRSITINSKADINIMGFSSELMINGQLQPNSEPLIGIKSQKIEKDKYLVNIELLNEAKRVGAVHGKLFLKTSDAQQKELPLDFYAYFR